MRRRTLVLAALLVAGPAAPNPDSAWQSGGGGCRSRSCRGNARAIGNGLVGGLIGAGGGFVVGLIEDSRREKLLALLGAVVGGVLMAIAT